MQEESSMAASAEKEGGAVESWLLEAAITKTIQEPHHVYINLSACQAAL